MLKESPNDYRWQLLQMRVYEKRISEAVVFFRANNIEPILIKGWAANRNYPERHLRRFVDIDLLIAPRQFDRAVACLENYTDNYLIDLHCGARHLDSLSYQNLFENSRLIKCLETDVRVLRPEDHLRVLCVHWLTDGGENKERLWDIYYAVANRPKDFDWERCLDEVSEKRKKWITCAIGLTHRYLRLDVKNTPFADKIIDIPAWMIKTVEREWESDEKLIPLRHCWHDKSKLFKQIKKRIPPNSIQATVDMEGKFDETPRIIYQIGDVFYRSFLSVKRMFKDYLSRQI